MYMVILMIKYFPSPLFFVDLLYSTPQFLTQLTFQGVIVSLLGFLAMVDSQS